MSPPASSIAFCLPRGPAWKASSRITGGDHPSVALPLRRCPSPPPPGGARKQDVKMFFGFGSKTETKTKTETETEDATSQWNLVKDTFRGTWSGKTTWYSRPEGGDQVNFETKDQDMDAVYDISFESCGEKGTWRGKGLKFCPGEEKVLPLTKKDPAPDTPTCLFPGGVGMQCQNKLSLVTNPNYGFPTNEVNFFDQRCRSMVVTMHKERGSKRVLDSVCITPFRCRQGCDIGVRPMADSKEALLADLKGWKGERLSRVPGGVDSFKGQRPRDVVFDASLFTSADVFRHFTDDIVIGVPDVIPEGKPFQMVYGCRVSDDTFKMVIVKYDADGDLQETLRDVYTKGEDKAEGGVFSSSSVSATTTTTTTTSSCSSSPYYADGNASGSPYCFQTALLHDPYFLLACPPWGLGPLC